MESNQILKLLNTGQVCQFVRNLYFSSFLLKFSFEYCRGNCSNADYSDNLLRFRLLGFIFRLCLPTKLGTSWGYKTEKSFELKVSILIPFDDVRVELIVLDGSTETCDQRRANLMRCMCVQCNWTEEPVFNYGCVDQLNVSGQIDETFVFCGLLWTIWDIWSF